MRAVFRLLVLVGLGFAVATSCALDQSGLSDNPDGGGGIGGGGSGGSGATVDCWGAEYKVCEGDCEDVSDPAFGCTAESCSPCALPQATAKCESNQCKIETCLPNYADCDLTEFNHDATGCETNLGTNPGHCGACGNNCFDIDTTKNWECNNGACQESDCPIGSANCGPNGECESISTDPNQCGACKNACSLPNANPKCVSVAPPVIGACEIDSCHAGWADCDTAQPNHHATGCETNISNDLGNCGACNNACTAPSNGIPFCNGGQCDFVCQTPYFKCNGACHPPNNNDPNNCGACGNQCQAPAGGTPTCAGGVCDFVCNAPLTRCGNACVNTATHQSHCGGCNQPCSAPTGGSVACQGGTCVGSCPSPQIICGTACVNPQTSNSHCGGCNQPCSNERTCQAGSCKCPTAQPTECPSSCEPQCCPGASCSPPTGGTCLGNGTCGCGGGLTNCGGTCVNTDTSPMHCGACGTACTNPHGTTSCVAGACTPVCAAGWGDCNGNPNDGCGTNTNTDSLNCGTCGTVCNNVKQGMTCQNGTCACPAGWNECSTKCCESGCGC